MVSVFYLHEKDQRHTDLFVDLCRGLTNTFGLQGVVKIADMSEVTHDRLGLTRRPESRFGKAKTWYSVRRSAPRITYETWAAHGCGLSSAAR